MLPTLVADVNHTPLIGLSEACEHKSNNFHPPDIRSQGSRAPFSALIATSCCQECCKVKQTKPNSKIWNVGKTREVDC